MRIHSLGFQHHQLVDPLAALSQLLREMKENGTRRNQESGRPQKASRGATLSDIGLTPRPVLEVAAASREFEATELCSPFIRYTIPAMFGDEPRICKVSFTDQDGMDHSVTVTARSRNEAAARALAQFRHNEFAEFWSPGIDDKLTVTALREEVHQVSVRKLQEWLNRHGPAPRDVVLKGELKKLFPEPLRRSKKPRR